MQTVDDIELLHAISVELIGEQDLTLLYGKIVDAAVSIGRSQFGTMQRLCPAGDPSGHEGELRLLASRGLPPEAIAFWQWVSPAAHSSCTEALKLGRRAIIPDFEAWDEIAGTEDLLAFRRTGIRSAQTTPLMSRSGELIGMISTHWSEPHEPSERDLRLLDILARQAADLLERTIAEEAMRGREKELALLTSELNHRVKNMLANVQAIASQTLKHCNGPDDFVAGFGGRIQSMARVHSQLSSNEWHGAQLAEIIRDQIKMGAADEARVSANGPAVSLEANLVPTIAMMMHELGTNSIKYGALSKPDGRVSIDWTVASDMLDLRWSESGGPLVKAPVRPGFGTKLIEGTAVSAGGSAKMCLGAAGVTWDIAIPLPKMTPQRTKTVVPVSNVRPATVPHAIAPNHRPLEGKRFLIVEDEPLVAMDIVAQLKDAGAEIVGKAGNSALALKLIDSCECDAALLDANLGGHPVDDIAATLTRKDVPFAFVTGYGRESLPVSFGTAAILAKPFERQQLLKVAVDLVAPSSEDSGTVARLA